MKSVDQKTTDRIRKMAASDVPRQTIRRALGVSNSTISRILKNSR